jgi:hypothetical protein
MTQTEIDALRFIGRSTYPRIVPLRLSRAVERLIGRGLLRYDRDDSPYTVDITEAGRSVLAARSEEGT